MPVVEFVVRSGCHLCQEARPVVHSLCRDARVECVERDVDGDDEVAKYTDHVPVVLIDGEEFSYWGVDPAQLKQRLTALWEQARW